VLRNNDDPASALALDGTIQLAATANKPTAVSTNGPKEIQLDNTGEVM
jgi:hypothetical protein